jgi:hypothetical protein
MAKKKIEVEKEGCNFILHGIQWKKGDFNWNLTISIDGVIDEAHSTYLALLRFNKKPFEEQIASIEADIEEETRAAKLFPDEQRKDIGQMEKRIVAVKKKLEEGMKKSDPITFPVTVLKIDWSKDIPKCVFAVGPVVCDWLNKEKHRVAEYEIVLDDMVIENEKNGND